MNPPVKDLLKVDCSLVVAMLTRFLREETRRIGIERLVVGLSGGLDSAMSAYLGVLALGPDKLIPVLMPHRLSSPQSLEHALLVVDALKVTTHHIIDISPQVDPYFANPVVPASSNPAQDRLRQGNKMARERMTILYDLSVLHRALVVGTSNKSEFLLGYTTIYGDMASAINPLGDLYKTQVFEIARSLSIPEPIIAKPPSADLWEGQSDEQELGAPYALLDEILFLLIDQRCRREEVLAMGYQQPLVDRIIELVRRNQYKRMPPVIAKVSQRTIGRDFRYSRDWGT